MSEDVEAANERHININVHSDHSDHDDDDEEAGENNLGFEEESEEDTRDSNDPREHRSNQGSEGSAQVNVESNRAIEEDAGAIEEGHYAGAIEEENYHGNYGFEEPDRSTRVRFESSTFSGVHFESNTSGVGLTQDTPTREKRKKPLRKKKKPKPGCCPGRFEFGSCTLRGFARLAKKYLWEGKEDECWDAEDEYEENSFGEKMRPQKKPPSCLYKYWTLWAFILPCLVVHVLWLAYAIKFNIWAQFQENYDISITVVFGALIAGTMSWGVGSVLYPMMVLGFGVAPMVTRDALLLIGAVGRTTLSTSIILLQHKVERHAVIACSLGGAGGVILGLEVIEPHMTDDIRTLVYISFWTVMGTVLFIYCFQSYKRCPTRDMIVEICFCRTFGMLVVSFAGGILTSIAGVGLEMFTFAILTIYFRIHSTVAGTTAVLVAASGTTLGFYWREVIQGGVLNDAWTYYDVSIPILIVCLPFGYIMHWHIHNLLLAIFGICLNCIALVTMYAKIDMNKTLTAITTCILIGGVLVLVIAAVVGVRVLRRKGLITSTPKKEKEVSNKRSSKHKTSKKNSSKKGNDEQPKEKKHRRRHVFLDYVGGGDVAGDLQKPGGFFGREWDDGNNGRAWGGGGGGGNVITFKELDANESDL